MKIEIRDRRIEDVNEFCEFLYRLDNEAEYMLVEKGERNIDAEVISGNIEAVIDNGDTCYIAKDEKNIVGYAIAVREKFIRTKHVATIVIGIFEDYCGKGIGSLLFQNIIDWATENNVKRLELTVIKENVRAVNLYKKYGFNIEGIREKATFMNGRYYDELYMAKILE
ncbi:GNAT family N-acetyltransferase [Sedimentibacter sp.]|uniref:GNAT family N-acetyltransferase n=1 Tax=Sedimentibacter sp. TaxID=1960295 RepID=UPI002898BE24|nr:GNAT family N-acetyltransferase [Sedimentibacter sp.]